MKPDIRNSSNWMVIFRFTLPSKFSVSWELNSLCKIKFLIFLVKFPVFFFLSGKMNIQIPLLPCAVATLVMHGFIKLDYCPLWPGIWNNIFVTDSIAFVILVFESNISSYVCGKGSGIDVTFWSKKKKKKKKPGKSWTLGNLGENTWNFDIIRVLPPWFQKGSNVLEKLKILNWWSLGFAVFSDIYVVEQKLQSLQRHFWGLQLHWMEDVHSRNLACQNILVQSNMQTEKKKKNSGEEKGIFGTQVQTEPPPVPYNVFRKQDGEGIQVLRISRRK